MYSYGEFRPVPDAYQYSAQIPSEFAKKWSEFVQEHAAQMRVFSGRGLPEITRTPEGYSLIGIGDQMVKFHVRDIKSPDHAQHLDSAYKQGNLVGLSYLAVNDSLKPKLVELLNEISSVEHDLVIDPPSVMVFDMSPSRGESGTQLWEMFPDSNEQRKLTEMSASDLGPLLWGSSEFVFAGALSDVAINVSPQKSIDICQAALKTSPSDKDAILKVVLQKKELVALFVSDDSYTPEQQQRLSRLVELMDGFLAEHRS